MRSNAASSAFLKGRDNDPPPPPPPPPPGAFQINVNIEKQQHPVSITVWYDMKVTDMQNAIHDATGMAPNDQRIVIGLGTQNPRELTAKDEAGTVGKLGLSAGATIKVFGKSHVGKK